MTVVDKAQANLLIKLGERLSFRQLCLLSIFSLKNKYDLPEINYKKKGPGLQTIALLQEIYDLYTIGVLNCGSDTLLEYNDVDPAGMNVQGMGLMIYQLMELENIEDGVLSDIIELF